MFRLIGILVVGYVILSAISEQFPPVTSLGVRKVEFNCPHGYVPDTGYCCAPLLGIPDPWRGCEQGRDDWFDSFRFRFASVYRRVVEGGDLTVPRSSR
jgi:hypothetical protein